MRRQWRELWVWEQPRFLVRLGVPILLALLGTRAIPAQQAKQIVEQAVRTELAADDNDHSRWLYLDIDRKPSNTIAEWVAETNNGDLKRILKENGKPLSTSEQQSRMKGFADNAAAQAKQHKSDHHDDQQARQMLSMLPQAFLWTKVKDQNGRTVLHFAPNPHFKASSNQARVFAAMEGKMTVDDAQHRIASLQGRMIHNVKFGFGVLGDLRAGGSFDVERREIGNGIWQITETHIHVAGRALLFKSISDQEDDVKSKFKELSTNLPMAGAEKLLMSQSD